MELKITNSESAGPGRPLLIMKALLLLLLADEATAFSLRARPVVSWMRPSGRAALVAVETETASNVLESLQTFQSSHAFLYGLIVTLATRYAIGEVRRIVEKPVMDELGNRVTESLTPETEAIPTSAWPKLALCVGMGAWARRLDPATLFQCVTLSCYTASIRCTFRSDDRALQRQTWLAMLAS